MSFSSKIEKPLKSSIISTPSFTLHRKSFGVYQRQPKNPDRSPSQLESSARLGHHLSQIGVSYHSPTIQTKLTIGKPGDRYEQEADQVAQQVVSMSSPQTLQQQPKKDEMQMKPAIQREEGDEDKMLMKPEIQREEGDEDEMLMKPELQRQANPKEEEKETVQAQSNGGLVTDTGNLEQQLSSSKGGGSALGDEVRGFMEPRFGADFSQVRIHTDSSANQMNQSIQAQAFTHGKDIYFNSGKYNPSSDEGKTLLAHELTHVVQQTGEQ